MAVTKIHQTSRLVMYVTIAITLVIIALFLFGGQISEEQRIVPDMSQPAFTDILLYWVYALLAITVIALLLFAVLGFIGSLKTNPKGAIGTIIVLVVFAALLGVTYSMGSGKLLNIVGYDGPDNVPGTLKMTDMWLYSMYVMLTLTILAILIPIRRIKSK